MENVCHKVTTRQFREHLSEVIERAMHGGERIGVTRRGKLAAVIVSVRDFQALKEMDHISSEKETK